MYLYYYLMAIKVVPKWFPAWIITLLQILQMVVGTFVVGAGVHFKLNGGSIFKPGECANDFYNMIAGVVMYGSYLLLFMDFAFGRYIYGNRGNRDRAPSAYSLKKIENQNEKKGKKEN